jgi:hypothetical protein
VARRDIMDEYSSLAGLSIITPPHGKVAGLTGKRGIGERKRKKKEGKEQQKREEDAVVLQAGMHREAEEKNGESDLRSLVQEKGDDREEGPIGYGIPLKRIKRKKRIDLKI